MNVIMVAIAICIVLIVTNILHIKEILTCKVETTGTYIKYNTVHNGRGVTYEPVFRYYVNGEEFQGCCMHGMSLSNIKKQFVVGHTYTIYVNDKKPDYFIINRKAPLQSDIGVLIGIIFLAGGLLLCLKLNLKE